MYNRAIGAIIFSNLNFIKAKRANSVLNCWQDKNKNKQTNKNCLTFIKKFLPYLP